ncbi:alpha/beta hydrolase [Sphingosinithalassobacter portus]|uniref:alpha/beta hydrolase n=1 Tax=Stakelama portus TaxID=2676234 RepID=UPI001EFE7AB3|nr:alpha/beta hydrolase [Sphingosinithalassobacter portus]
MREAPVAAPRSPRVRRLGWRGAVGLALGLLVTACATPEAAQAPASVSASASHTGTVPFDLSYTISSRFAQNRAEHPDYRLPEVALSDGRRLLFERRYREVDGRELHLDLFLPAASAKPAQTIVLVHGGAWRSGDKSNFYAIADHLSRAGYAVALPAFRLAPQAAYPAGLTDINAAIGWLRDNAAMLGIDAARIAIGGESSGGQMAALLAYSCGTPLFSADGNAAPAISALIDIDGVLDFTTPLALANENRAGVDSPAAKWLGGSWEQIPDRWREASAATHLSPAAPPTLVISGEAARFTAGWDAVQPALDRWGIANAEIHFAGQPHTFWLFEPYAGQVADAIDGFLQRQDVAAARPCVRATGDTQ